MSWENAIKMPATIRCPKCDAWVQGQTPEEFKSELHEILNELEKTIDSMKKLIVKKGGD